ncbi:hypothetical protein ACHAWF_006328 [Thalassiosira exigua]
MHQRRHHSAAASSDAALNGAANGESREGRRLERRMAKERRGVQGKKLRRVKKSVKYGRGKSPFPWDDEHVKLGLLAFGLFAFFGTTTYRAFHKTEDGFGGRSTRWRPSKAGEYNSDNAGGSLLSRIRERTKGKYAIPESMKKVGNKARWYAGLREEWDARILPRDDDRSVAWVEEERARQGSYQQHVDAETPYDIHDCPPKPPKGYPVQWPVLDVLENWPTDDPAPKVRPDLYQGLCVFDYRTDRDKALAYQRAELPFVSRNDPAAARTAERWNAPGYVERLLHGKEDVMRRCEYSPNNHFMYWVDKRNRQQKKEAREELKARRGAEGGDAHAGFGRGAQAEMKEAMRTFKRLTELKKELADAKKYREDHEDDDEASENVKRLQRRVSEAKEEKDEDVIGNWQPPTENTRMTYRDWLKKANVTDDQLGPDNPHWYFRLIGCGAMGKNTEDGSCDKGSSEWLFDELTFFQPRTGDERSLYLVDPKQQKGIHCRFGMKGVIAENHFDLSRNAIALLMGKRRYLLSHPNNCAEMNLLPRGHPSARHSAVDWSDPDLETFPTFADATVNEVVLQPGDVLYLPTNWFHYIVSLELNMQCNTRSGGEHIYHDEITRCGF